MRWRAILLTMLTWRSPCKLHGLPVWTPFLSAAESDRARSSVGAGLDLLRDWSPARYARVTDALGGILVFGIDPTTAAYFPERRLCLLTESFLLSPSTSPAAVATVLVHEATHGWLCDRGIGYSEPIRHRVEQICIRAALLTARRFPTGGDQVERCRRQLTLGVEFFSDRSFARRQAERLRAVGCPEFLIRALGPDSASSHG